MAIRVDSSSDRGSPEAVPGGGVTQTQGFPSARAHAAARAAQYIWEASTCSGQSASFTACPRDEQLVTAAGRQIHPLNKIYAAVQRKLCVVFDDCQEPSAPSIDTRTAWR